MLIVLVLSFRSLHKAVKGLTEALQGIYEAVKSLFKALSRIRGMDGALE